MQTNADSKLTKDAELEGINHEKRVDFLRERERVALEAEKRQGVISTPTRYWFQKEAFSFDSKREESRAAREGRTSLDVKEYVIGADGSIEKILADEQLDMVKNKEACWNCEEYQPTNFIEKDVAWDRSVGVFGHPGPGASPETHCVYCMARLGFNDNPAGKEQRNSGKLSPHQLKMLLKLGIDPDGGV